MARRIVVGISGATGFQYGYKALELLKPLDIEVHLVMSKGAEMTRTCETAYESDEVEAMADVVHPIENIGASIASGSFKTMGMLIAPCSMRTLAAVAHGMSDNLLIRAADVVLKDRRRLVMLARETPLNLSHIDNMRKVTEMGGIISPPVPAFYAQPETIDQLVSNTISRVLDMFGIDVKSTPRWTGSDCQKDTPNSLLI